jgi:pyruvate formate lyase activating enzyme
MSSGIVFDIQKFSLHDGPGIRTTVFLKGCGLRCWWCHNPESQRPHPELLLRTELCIHCGACMGECPQGAIRRDGGQFITDRNMCARCGACVAACAADARELVGQEMTVEQVIHEVLLDAIFYDESGGGVTFSGGEPLLQGDFLFDLLQACKAHDLHTVVDTCGYAQTDILARVRPYVDLFLYDVKVMDDALHRQVTGASNRLILDNLHYLAEHNHPVLVRVPVIPNVNDDENNLRQIGEMVHSMSNVQGVSILAYHKLGKDKYERLGRPNPMPETAEPSEDAMLEIKCLLESYGLDVTIGG